MRKTLVRFVNRLPYKIREIPYLALFLLVKRYLHKNGCEIWARNSLYFSEIIFGLSDIDFTFFFTKKVQHQDILLKLEKYFFFKKILPVLGEVNIYQESEVEKYWDSANPCELARDPQLLNYFSRRPPLPERESKIVFILRMLNADAHNLQKNFNLRENKWKFHLNNVDLSFSASNLEALIDYLQNNLFGKEIIIKDFLIKYLNYRDTNINSINEFYNLIDIKQFILVLPSRWIGASIANKRLSQDLKIISEFSLSEQQIYVEQIKWEIWGIYTQIYTLYKKATFNQHLDNIKLTLDYIRKLDTSIVAKEIVQLKKLVSEILKSEKT